MEVDIIQFFDYADPTNMQLLFYDNQIDLSIIFSKDLHINHHGAEISIILYVNFIRHQGKTIFEVLKNVNVNNTL